jgi:uncharacterized protein YbaP (TraB family)
MKKMKKVITLTMVLIISAFILQGQESKNSLLWEISGNGLEQSSYLYGTFHLLCPEDLELSKKVTGALNKSEHLVLELDFDDPDLMPTLQQNMMMSDGSTAEDYLNDEEYELLAGFFNDSLNMPFERIKGIKPFFLSSMTISHFLGCKPASFEQRLTKIAQNKKMEVKGLETVKEQISFIDNLSMDMKKKMLMENLEEYKKSKKMFRKQINYYLNENLEGLNSIIDDYMSNDYASLREDLLVKRNKNWVPEIRKMIQEKPSLIAVGAGHLPGSDGLLELLREAGYSVEPVH